MKVEIEVEVEFILEKWKCALCLRQSDLSTHKHTRNSIDTNAKWYWNSWKSLLCQNDCILCTVVEVLLRSTEDVSCVGLTRLGLALPLIETNVKWINQLINCPLNYNIKGKQWLGTFIYFSVPFILHYFLFLIALNPISIPLEKSQSQFLLIFAQSNKIISIERSFKSHL